MSNCCRLATSLVALASGLTPAMAMAAPATQLDKSATYAFGNEVHAFRVPTTDSAGKIKYNDVVIKLTVGATGVIATSATVTVTASVNPPTSVNLVPGSYKASDGTTCTVTNRDADRRSHTEQRDVSDAVWDDPLGVLGRQRARGHRASLSFQSCGMQE